MNFADLFDLSKTEHKNLFEKSTNLWDPIKVLNEYLDKYLKAVSKEVFVGKNTKIDSTAKIVGPAIIGSNCDIKDGALIREGVIIGDGCVVGHGSEVKHSIIFNDSNIAHLNYIGDSIIGSGVNFAAGAITANFKHGAKNEIVNIIINDEKTSTGLKKFGSLVGDNAKIGCNVVIEPGTIIGKRTLIYPLVSARGTIPEDKIVKYKQNLNIVDQE